MNLTWKDQEFGFAIRHHFFLVKNQLKLKIMHTQLLTTSAFTGTLAEMCQHRLSNMLLG